MEPGACGNLERRSGVRNRKRLRLLISSLSLLGRTTSPALYVAHAKSPSFPQIQGLTLPKALLTGEVVCSWRWEPSGHTTRQGQYILIGSAAIRPPIILGSSDY